MLAALALAAAVSAAPVETFVDIPGGAAPLKATMLAPASGSKAPAIVILPGSGPTDRNGDNRYGVSGGVYKRLAEGLAAEGATTLRMDKRGMFASGPAADPNAVTVADLAVDANAWAAKLKAETGAKCVWLLGHSEGGLVALLAARDGKDLCGIILVAAGGRPLGEVIREQLRTSPNITPELLAPAMKAIDELEAGRKVDAAAIPQPLLPVFHPAVQGFLIEMFRHDPAKLAAGYKGPMLILQGATDLQVKVADAEALKTGQPNAKLVILPGVNHVLKLAPSDRAANVATYADPSLPLAPGVVDTIAGFVKGQPGTN
ncbi:MAG: alpha/beta fold hydrolase [Caulobacter sp.]|nr:alpha/beta fold hydrolase [Caulobacter sp.]